MALAKKSKKSKLTSGGVTEHAETVIELAARTQNEKDQIGGPTLFVNRFIVQGYPDTGIRMAFGEQYSGDLSIPPAFRAAVFMHTPTAAQLAQTLINMLPPGSVVIPPAGSKKK